MILHIIRAIFLLIVLAFTVSFGLQSDTTDKGEAFVIWYMVLPPILALIVIIVDMFWRQKRLNVLSGMFFGLLAGLVVAYILTMFVDLVMQIYPAIESSPIPPLLKALLGAAAVFLCVTIVMQTKDDFRFIIPYVEFSKQSKGSSPMLLDTSVIIDGRIADIMDTKIFQSALLVPRFVLLELQTIADSAEKLKRNRGRRGLDVLQKLQQNKNVDIDIIDLQTVDVENAHDVDAKLVALAEHMDAKIMTNDYNLNKIAQLRGIDVVNINDLSNALKPIVLPGEQMAINIIKPGEEPGQGVGYLDDGTMVVVEQGRKYLNQNVAITVTSALQTSAGRMIFGKADPVRFSLRQNNHRQRTLDGQEKHDETTNIEE